MFSTFCDIGTLDDLRADPVERACTLARRGLTMQEWTRYVPDFPYEPSCPGDPPAGRLTR